MQVSDPTAASVEDTSSSVKDYRYFIGGIQRHITQQDIERYFAAFGDFEGFTMKRDSAGNSRGYGWISYRSPPLGIARQDPHVLKGVALTVEQARSRGPHEGNRSEKRSYVSEGASLRRRRSRSPSSSSSSSVASRRGNYRRFTSSRQENANSTSRLPAIAVGNSRLPPLSTQMYSSAPPAQSSTSTTSHGNVVSTNNCDDGNTMTETYLCIPITLCPSEYLSDPRTFCARLDQNRVGSLNIVPTPLVSTNAASVSVPPPPPPPPPSTRNLSQYGLIGERDSRNNAGLPQSVSSSTTTRVAMQRGMTH
ncbi:hypothetical protein TCSYLVIO_009730 [Trypanosoma cruzi]|uniref:RRM domain-containing protein n=2 Tax=Trypanosoma cruzi TaxID=5693 RepID=V5BNU6_TRYCR|nr:hypothetical protein TCSYLVIO_009730 [Trypanosoma cruzi]ESS69484.1 hypothetical protein TCDM_01744 [Trypanosoma cruzi Dm28c]PBJ74360.1 hypothetical protein BCY84_12606 [Trypanosoma cruzi cruzi]PWU91160.1 hypothetical protein C4B63_45g126 [Trypanosoma cruzi]RNF21365.1 putative RNA-binding protein [Trypanosoma cruzi]